MNPARLLPVINMHGLSATFGVAGAPSPHLEIQLQLPCFYGNAGSEAQIRLTELSKEMT
jgi:hypothetical protein